MMLSLDDISIVVPYRRSEGHRERIAEWTFARLKRVFPECELILGQETEHSPYFCRSQAINNGVRLTSRPLILISDADVLVPRAAIQMAVDYLNEDPNLGWVIPYNMYIELSPYPTEQILNAEDLNLYRSDLRLESEGEYPDSNASLILITKEAFVSVNGFDERFKGWGPEDQAWAEAVTTLCGPYRRVRDYDLYHLWHPVKLGTTTDNPHYENSMKHWDWYKISAGDPKSMACVVRGNHD